MDMTDAMCRKIDELYNPSSLIERVNQTYNIIRERTKIITDNIVKLDAILDIVKENIGKRIRILLPIFSLTISSIASSLTILSVIILVLSLIIL
jgi:Mg2+ and Co2+ transporter CorA